MKVAIGLGYVLIPLIVFSSAMADQKPRDFKLFHTPKPTALSNTDSKSEQTKNPVLKQYNLVSEETSDLQSSYRYDGFVSSATGKSYLVNGQPLNTLVNVLFMSASEDGYEIKLKTKAGLVLSVTIGETVVDQSR